MKDYFGYAGKKCVVTGGSNGMGKVGVEMLIDLGAKVYVLDFLPCDIEGVEYIKVDLSDRSSIDEAFKALPDTIDKFFGFAGISGVNSSIEMIFKVNFLSNKYMLESYLFDRVAKGGAIAFVTSGASRGWDKHPEEYLPMINSTYDEALDFIKANEHNLESIGAYSLTKRALANLIKSNVIKYYEKEIRINYIQPGFTKTRLYNEFASWMNNDPALVAMSYGAIKRDGTPEEMAPAILFLNSDMASFITGEGIFIDGGYAALADLGVLQYDTSGPYFKGPVVNL